MPAQMALVVGPGDGDVAYAEALDELDAANTKVNNDPEEHIEALADAIEAVESFSRQLADDEQGSDLLELASLNFARALLRVGRRADAAEVMDELLRKSLDSELPVERFGPTLVEFHAARRAALQVDGTAEVEFECEVDCRVLLDRHAVSGSVGPLYLGSYDVVIESADGSLPPETQRVELDSSGEVLTVRYPMAGLVEEEVAPPKSDRLMPRWAEILMTTVGVGAVGAASGLLAIDGRCAGGLPPVDDNGVPCPRLVETTAAGATMLGLGAALLTAGALTLTIDELKTRSGKSEHQAMIHWRMRF